MNSIELKFYFFIFLFCAAHACNAQTNSLINSSHLDYLYEKIEVDNREMAVIHIYSNYPDYEYVGDDDEGFACVDDAARAAIFYLNNFKNKSEEESLEKNKKLLEFILYLQADNGYFYNFIWEDYSINKEFKTSVAEPNWWSWRALWTLTESYKIYEENDPSFAKRIWSSVEKLIEAQLKNIPDKVESENIDGFEIPTWLPHKYGSDQAAVLLLGLINYYEEKHDERILDYINLISEGIVKMQIAGGSKINGAFLSWENDWHAWGNLQSYALLKSHQAVGDSSFLNAALFELDNFYEYLIKNNFLNSFSVKKDIGEIEILHKNRFPQIAYNIRPVIYALIEANKITGKKKYSDLAVKASAWFFDGNPANAQIYFPETGIVFDGIESEDFINKNSGAESTIEALLSLQKLEENGIDLKLLMNH